MNRRELLKGASAAAVSGTALKTIETPVMGDEEMCKHLQDCYDKTPRTSTKSADKVYVVRVYETVGLSGFVPNVK